MSSLPQIRKTWEGKIAAGKFPLLRWLGDSDSSTVYLTELSAPESRKAAIKLISAEKFAGVPLNEEAQLLRWAESAKLAHPNLIRLYAWGRCDLEGKRFLYVVTEYAEEDLGQILPLRALSPAEVSEMVSPITQALSFLHRSGFVHGHIKPSNIVAIDDQLKISIDGLRKPGEAAESKLSVYDAPEAAKAVSPESDVWSFGAVLAAVLTQREPVLDQGNTGSRVRTETVPPPFREIVQQCLRANPQERGTLSDIPAMLEGRPIASVTTIDHSASRFEDRSELPASTKQKPRTLLLVVAALLLLAVVFGARWMFHHSATSAENHPTESQPSPAIAPPAQPVAPTAENSSPNKGSSKGTVLQQITPEISRGARNTIHGRVKVEIQLSVNDAGNVTQAKFVSAGPSQYFANQAMTASRHWKFNPPQVDGKALPSEWILRFQFGRTSTQILPTEIKP
jgi:TonB family protein